MEASAAQEISRPGQEAYEAATHVFNLTARPHPAGAVIARTVADVTAAIRYADRNGLRLRVHTTGHAAATSRPMHNALLISTQFAQPVEIDPVRGVARMTAGTRWGEVVAAAAPYGLTAPHGSSPTVGVVGYLLRGGVSLYGRKTGLAANSVRAIELVTADGELRRVSATADPELFWALRGGGGGFGVVTAIEIGLLPAAMVVTGAAFWPASHVERLLTTWREWTLTAPEEAATSLRVMNLPADPDIPPILTGQPVVCVAGAVLSETADPAGAQQIAADLLEPLRSVAAPLLDTWEPATPEGVLQAHMDPSDPVAILGDHMLLDELGEDGAAEFVRLAGPGSPLVVAELRQLGGALSVPHPGGGALSHFAARYAYMVVGIPGNPATPAKSIAAHCARARSALAPWDTGRTAPTFVEDYVQPQGHLSGDAIAAVDRVRLRIDPQGRFRDDITTNATGLRRE